MKIKLTALTIASLCASGLVFARHHTDIAVSLNVPAATPVYAEDEPPAYSPAYAVPQYEHEHHHHHHYRHRDIDWIPMSAGQPLPADAVVGGSQPYPPATLFVCRAPFRGGMHPGKLMNGYCNIGWGGSEYSLASYEVLVSRYPLSFAESGNGYVPANAIIGGHQHDGPLYICQANYHGGMHPGKVVAGMCNIGWRGREVAIPYYNVLVR